MSEQTTSTHIVGLPLAMLKIANGDVRRAGNVPEEWVRLFKPTVIERIRRHTAAMARYLAQEKLERLRRRQ